MGFKEGEGCCVINHSDIAYNGRIPALLFTSFELEDSVVDRFRSFNYNTNRNLEEFINVIDEFMSGNMSHASVVQYHALASFVNNGKLTLQWPMCFMHLIFGLFDRNIIGVKYLLLQFDSLKTHQGEIHTGKWWETVVAIAIIFRFLLAVNRSDEGPFSICDSYEAVGATIAVKYLVDDVETPEAAREQINKLLANETSKKNLWLILPKGSRFEQFDGFVVFSQANNKALLPKICGYQCKHGAANSSGENPDWMESCILLRGHACSNAAYPRGWDHWNRDSVVDFLGASLGALYPDFDLDS
jgi:hypothetical protein